MKLNLLRNSNEVLSDYINIDAIPGDNKVQGDITNLNEFVDDASCEMIMAHNVLEYYEFKSITNILKHWVSKLKHNGVLMVVTTDLRAVAKSMIREAMQPDEYLTLIFGSQEGVLTCKKSGLTLDLLASIMESLGLKIITKRIADYKIVVTGERP